MDKVDTKNERSIRICTTCPLQVCTEEQGDDGELNLATISRVAVARAVHCVPEHISQIFLGKAVPSLPLAYDIAHYLGVTLDDLYRATTGSNGHNPARKFRPTWRADMALPPKYTVEGIGYPNLREALAALGIDRRSPTHYNQLTPAIRDRITRNRPFRGR